ncbi:DUF502 domain-containing protein, partial [Thiocapsa sp.]|uniref:DUF502 domain-containing protein n=1 Tax=Thiocapsa sp. TaxID=2024551 RepID=UPI0035937958
MTHLIGRRILSNVEGWLKRIPFVTTVYGATKRLVEAFQTDGIETSVVSGGTTAPDTIRFNRPGAPRCEHPGP